MIWQDSLSCFKKIGNLSLYNNWLKQKIPMLVQMAHEYSFAEHNMNLLKKRE